MTKAQQPYASEYSLFSLSKSVGFSKKLYIRDVRNNTHDKCCMNERKSFVRSVKLMIDTPIVIAMPMFYC